MNIEDIKVFLEENKSKDEVQQFLSGLQNKVDVTTIEKLSQEDTAIKSWLDSQKDRHSAKSLETWKTNNLQSLIDEKIKEQNPDKSPQDLELEKIKKQLADMENEKRYSELKNTALTVAGEKGIPTNLLDFFIGEDEEATLNNLTKFQEETSAYVQSEVDKRIKENSYKPPAGSGGADLSTGSKFAEQANKESEPAKNTIWD